MVGKNHDAQTLTLRLLQIYDSLERQSIYKKARHQLSGNSAAIKQLELCVLMAGELDNDPSKYNEFTTVAKTIIARSKNCKPEQITKKGIWITMGGTESSANNIIDRIHDHARELSHEEILSLCSVFNEEYNRVFWENQIYHIFPALPTPDVTDGPVFDCLSAVWNSMATEEQEAAAATLFSHSAWFEQLENHPEHTELSEHSGLYDILSVAQKKAGIKQTSIYNELNIDADTYNTYRKLWGAFERSGFMGPYPKRRLSRDRLLFLSYFLNMDFYTAVGMLAIAGYCFRSEEPDTTLAGYLLDRRYSKGSVQMLIEKKLHYREK